jgi:hypothetical protein
LDANHFDELLRSLSVSLTRRGVGWTLAVFAFGGTLGRFSLAETEAKKRNRKRKKKKCNGGKKKCGKGCCGPASQCAFGICYCTGNEQQANPSCVDVATTLIEIIAEETGVAPGIIGANPEEPLDEQVTIDVATLEAIDDQIKQTFGVEEEVPYYTEGIAAGAAVIREELQKKG